MPAIRNVTMSKTQFSFEGNWVGPQPGHTVHTLRRADLPGGVNTVAEIENFINNTWLQSEFKDTSGAVTGFARLHVRAINSPTDIDWELRIGDDPIPQWW